jgi:hypothetical protein
MCIPSIGGTVTSGSPSLRAEICALDLGKVWIQYPASTKLNKEEAHMGRPTGVTVIAVLYFLGAVLLVLGGIGMMVGGGFIATLISQQGGQGSGAGAGVFGALGAIAGIFFLVFAAIDFLVGWGLIKLKGWARIIAIVFAVLGALGALFGLVGVFTHFGMFIVFWTLVRLAICGWMIWYLLQPNVSAAFQGGKTGAATA